jgi:hypothetical protein
VFDRSRPPGQEAPGLNGLIGAAAAAKALQSRRKTKFKAEFSGALE